MKLRILKSPASELPFAMGVPAVIWQLLFFYVPLIVTLFTCVLTISESGHLSGVTLGRLTHFLAPTYLKVIAASLALALGNALICLCIAYPLAYFLAFTRTRVKNFLLFLLIIPFWTNFLLHVYAWFFVLEREGVLNTALLAMGLIHEPLHLLNSLFATMIMMVYYSLPFMAFPIYFSLEKLDVRLIEASVDLGASWLQTLRRIVLPLTLPGIRTGFFLVYIPSFGEFAIPELMGGDRQMFFGTLVSRYILGEQTRALGCAFAVVASTIVLLTSLLLYWLLNRAILPKKGYG